jgi:hypothetical protein
MRSDDGSDWIRQPGYVLADAGKTETDRARGQHPDVIVAGDRAYIVYFVHQSGEPQAVSDPHYHRRSVLQIAALRERNGVISVDRDAPTQVVLKPRG